MQTRISLWEAIQAGHASAALAGLLGGVVYIATNKNLGARESVAAVVVGGILAAYIAPVVGDWIDADRGLLSLLGLMIGVAGMAIGPILSKGGETIARGLVARLGGEVKPKKEDPDDTNP